MSTPLNSLTNIQLTGSCVSKNYRIVPHNWYLKLTYEHEKRVITFKRKGISRGLELDRLLLYICSFRYICRRNTNRG